jgi:hypothetical protein
VAVVGDDGVDGVCDVGDCDDGVGGDGAWASATLAESTMPLVQRPVLIIRAIDINPPTRHIDFTGLPAGSTQPDSPT